MSPSYCQLCGKGIDGRPKTYRHQKWARDLSLNICTQCAQTKPRCRVCGLPMESAPPNGVCVTCRRYDRYCYACGQAIKHKYVQFNGVGHYCETCYRQRASCDVCGAPLTDAQWRLSDGRVTCAYCHASAVYDPSDAAALYTEMGAVLDRLLDMRLNIPTGLALVDRNQLGEIILRQRENTRSTAPETIELNPQHTLGLYCRGKKHAGEKENHGRKQQNFSHLTQAPYLRYLAVSASKRPRHSQLYPHQGELKASNPPRQVQRNTSAEIWSPQDRKSSRKSEKAEIFSLFSSRNFLSSVFKKVLRPFASPAATMTDPWKSLIH